MLGLWMVFHVQIASRFTRLQTDSVDPRLVQYTLERTHRLWAGHGDGRGFWNPPIFYPTPRAGALTESMLGLQPFYSPWRLLGATPESAYQAATLGLLAACFAAAYGLFRSGLGRDPLAASVAAFLFAFALPRSAQIAHVQLFAHYATPLALWGLARACAPEASRERRRAGVAWFLGAFGLQVLGTVYLAWFLALAVSLAGLVVIATPNLRAVVWLRLRVTRRFWLAGGTVTVTLLLLFLAPYAAMRLEVDPEHAKGFVPALPHLQSFLMGGWGSWESQALGLAHWWRIDRMPLPWEQALCPGLFTLALAGFGFWRRRRSALARIVAITSGLLVVLVLRWPGGFSLWPLVERFVPAAEMIRAPARVGLLLLLPAGLGVAWALEGLRRAPRGRRLGVAGAVALVVLEQGQTQASYPKGQLAVEVSRIVSFLPAGCDAFLVTAVQGGTGNPQSTDFGPTSAMFASLETGIPTLNGYSGYPPAGWWGRTGKFLLDTVPPHQLLDLAAELRRLGAPVERLCWLRLAVDAQGLARGSRSWTEARPGRADVVTEEHPGDELIFADGFEGGDPSRWSDTGSGSATFDPAFSGQ